MTRRPTAEAVPPGTVIQEELTARGWTTADLAARMGSDHPARDQLAVDLLIAVHDPRAVLDVEMARGLGRAFGVDPMFFLNLDAAYRARCAAQATDGGVR